MKELELTEGRGTGFPTIYREMEKNGSPEPVFETDKACTYFLTVLPANASFIESTQATTQAVDEMANEYISRTVELLDGEMRANEILAKLNLAHYKHFRKTYLNPSIEGGYVEMTIPDKPSSPNQKYRLTHKGALLKAKLANERE